MCTCIECVCDLLHSPRRVWNVLGLNQTMPLWPGPDPLSLCWRTNWSLWFQNPLFVCQVLLFFRLSSCSESPRPFAHHLTDQLHCWMSWRLKCLIDLDRVLSLYWIYRAHFTLKSFAFLVNACYTTSAAPRFKNANAQKERKINIICLSYLVVTHSWTGLEFQITSHEHMLQCVYLFPCSFFFVVHNQYSIWICTTSQSHYLYHFAWGDVWGDAPLAHLAGYSLYDESS